MTRIYYDTEFLEDGSTIELLSIGLITESGDDSYYAVRRDFPWHRIASRHPLTRRWTTHEPWLLANVVPHLPRLVGDAINDRARPGPLGMLDWWDRAFKPRDVIAHDVRAFLQRHPNVQLWADYGAYDHVVLCQLWGRMIHLPMGVPMFTHDFQHELDRLGRPELPARTETAHHALADARALRTEHRAVTR